MRWRLAGTNLGIPAWNQGALRSSASSFRLFRLSVLSGKGGGVGVEPWVLPSAGTELLDVLICDLLFDLNSASVPESGQLCPILKRKRWKSCHSHKSYTFRGYFNGFGEGRGRSGETGFGCLTCCSRCWSSSRWWTRWSCCRGFRMVGSCCRTASYPPSRWSPRLCSPRNGACSMGWLACCYRWRAGSCHPHRSAQERRVHLSNPSPAALSAAACPLASCTSLTRSVSCSHRCSACSAGICSSARPRLLWVQERSWMTAADRGSCSAPGIIRIVLETHSEH